MSEWVGGRVGVLAVRGAYSSRYVVTGVLVTNPESIEPSRKIQKLGATRRRSRSSTQGEVGVM